MSKQTTECLSRLEEKFQYVFEDKLIKEICDSGRIRHYEADESLIEIGDWITYMPLVLSGSIKIMTEDQEGSELLLYYLELGDTCAVTLNCCTKKTKSTIRAVTEQPSEILFIPVEKMEEWMVRYQSWRAYVLDSYNIRLNEMLGAIDNLVFNSMEERLKKYLHDKAWINKAETLHISHYDIAQDLHTSRVVISRLMKKLEKEGLIIQNRNKIEYRGFRNPI